jgi:hypothetical protein
MADRDDARAGESRSNSKSSSRARNTQQQRCSRHTHSTMRRHTQQAAHSGRQAPGRLASPHATVLQTPCCLFFGPCLQQYILANAAVSRSFSAYFAALIGKPTTFFTFPYQVRVLVSSCSSPL